MVGSHYGEQWHIQQVFIDSLWRKSVSDLHKAFVILLDYINARKKYEKRIQVKISGNFLWLFPEVPLHFARD